MIRLEHPNQSPYRPCLRTSCGDDSRFVGVAVWACEGEVSQLNDDHTRIPYP